MRLHKELPAFIMPSLGKPWPFPVSTIANGWGVSVATITPDLAELILKTNREDNRNKRRTVLDRYVSDMAEGRWKLTHEGIAFDASGALSDGQHRCESCIKSGRPFQTLVFFGVGGDEEMAAINIGAMRSHADAAAIKGYDIDHKDIATLKMFLSGVNVDQYLGTHSQMIEMYGRYETAMKWVRTAATNKSGINKVLTSAIRGAAARAFYHAEPDRITRYLNILRDAISPSEPGDRSAVVLRHSLLNTKVSGGFGRRELYCKAQRSIHAYLNGEDLSKLYATNEDLFPLPSEEQLLARR